MGKNVSLTCNLTSSLGIIWYVLRSDQLLPLLSVTWSKMDGAMVKCHTEDSSRLKNKVDKEGEPISLEILEVEEEDAGLYFCSGRSGEEVYVNRGIHLAVEGKTIIQRCRYFSVLNLTVAVFRLSSIPEDVCVCLIALGKQ